MPFLQCVALGTVVSRKITGKNGERTVRAQDCLFDQGYERRKFRRELGPDEAPMAEGTKFELNLELGVNQYGDLELSRAGRTVRVVTSEKAK